MKKVLFLVLASFLALAACGNSEESKSEDKKEKSDKEETSNADNNQQDDTEQQTQSVEQPQSTQGPVQSQEEVQPVEQQQQPVQQEPTDQEKMEANAKVAKENGYTGIPNGDAGLLEPSSDGYYSNDQLDPDTGLPMDDAVPHKNGEEESEWASAQDEWNNASESEKTEIRKADAKKYGYEYNPNDYK